MRVGKPDRSPCGFDLPNARTIFSAADSSRFGVCFAARHPPQSHSAAPIPKSFIKVSFIRVKSVTVSSPAHTRPLQPLLFLPPEGTAARRNPHWGPLSRAAVMWGGGCLNSSKLRVLPGLRPVAWMSKMLVGCRYFLIVGEREGGRGQLSVRNSHQLCAEA